MGMLSSEPEPKLPNNYSSALSQLHSLERRLQREPNLKNLLQKSIDTEVQKGFVKILDESEVKGIFEKEWYFRTPSSPKPKQAWQSETCLQCCIKVQRGMPKRQATSRA